MENMDQSARSQNYALLESHNVIMEAHSKVSDFGSQGSPSAHWEDDGDCRSDSEDVPRLARICQLLLPASSRFLPSILH